MQCGMCREEAVTFQQYSGKYLCRRHFIEDIEAKAKHAIRNRGWLKAGDHIGVDFSGDGASTTLLFFLHHIFSRRKDIRITAVITGNSCDEDQANGCTIEFARNLEIPVIRVSLPDMSGFTTHGDTSPESVTGVHGAALRSGILDKVGKVHGITKIASGFCLDDEALSILTDVLRGEAGHIFTRRQENRCDRLTVITPFIGVSKDDIALYVRERGLRPCCPSRGSGPDAFENEVRAMLDTYTGRHPSTKYSLMHLGETISDTGAAAGIPPDGSARCESPVSDHDSCRFPEEVS